MKFFICNVVIMALATQVQPNIVLMPEAMYFYTNPSAKVDNYILQHQRQFEDQMRVLGNYLADFRKGFRLRLEVMEYYEAVVDAKLRGLRDKLDPLEMLGDINDVCVEKYRHKIPSDSSLKDNLKMCINKARVALPAIVNNPENILKNIRNHYNNQFNNAIKECKKKFEKDEMKFKACATTTIKNTNSYFDTNTIIFNTQMTASECSANTKIAESFDCYSLQIYHIFTTLGEVNGLIENCLAGYDICAACEVFDDDAIKGRCPYQMAWHLDDEDLKGEKIANPFKGINSTTPCLQVNFITRTFVYSGDKE